MRVIVAVLASLVWLKGNLHTHTSMSDGDSTPQEWRRGIAITATTSSSSPTTTRSRASRRRRILLIPGEEVTAKLPKKPLARERDRAHTRRGAAARCDAGGGAAAERRRRARGGRHRARESSELRLGVRGEELLQLRGVTLLEIASGHPYVNTQGPPTVEAMWDELLTAGHRVWGVAVDDSHHLKRPWDTDVALPGKAWVVVRAQKADAKSILGALERGEFYASTGVELEDFGPASVKVKEKNLAHYRIQFIGAKGRVLQETADTWTSYKIRGDEGYVRVKVIDSNGRCAWTQPTFCSITIALTFTGESSAFKITPGDHHRIHEPFALVAPEWRLHPARRHGDHARFRPLRLGLQHVAVAARAPLRRGVDALFGPGARAAVERMFTIVPPSR